MPLYEYEHVEVKGESCAAVFEFAHSISEPLSACPTCGHPVRKRVTRFGVGENLLSASNIKDKGFQRWVRKDKGVYEKE